MKRHVDAVALVCTLVVLAGGLEVRAGVDTFFARTSDVWTNAANWDNGLPAFDTTNTTIGSTTAGKTNPATVYIHAGDSCVASNLYLGRTSTRGTGTLIMDGGYLSATYISLASSGGTGIIVQTGGVISNGAFWAQDGASTAGYSSWTVSGPNTIVSNSPAVSRFPRYAGGARAYLTISNGASMVGGNITLGYASGGYGTITVASGGSLSGLAANLAVGVDGDGTLVVSNATLNTGAFGIAAGSSSAGGGAGHITFIDATVTVASISIPGEGGGALGGRADLKAAGLSVVTNYGVLNLGIGPSGDRRCFGDFTMTGGRWWQGGVVRVPACKSYASTGTITIVGGAFLPQSDIYIATLLYNTGTFILSNVTVATTGTVTVGSSPNNNSALVALYGSKTQCLFTASNFWVYATGSVTNHLAGYAGGVDISGTNATCFSVSSTGVVALVFEKNPTVTGLYWGLRWRGTNHVAALNAYHTNIPPRLIWDDSALSALYTNQVGVYTDTTYTYVGIQVTKLVGRNGTALYFR